MEMMYNNTNNEQNNRLYNKYKEDEDDSSESEKEAMFGRRKTATALRFYDDNDDDSDASFFRDVEVSDEEGEDEDEDTIFLEKSSRGPKKNSVVVKENNFLTRQRTRAYNAETSEEDYAMHEISDVSQHGGTVPFDVALSAEYAHRDRFSITSPLHTKGTPSRQKGNNSESGELEDLEEGLWHGTTVTAVGPRPRAKVTSTSRQRIQIDGKAPPPSLISGGREGTSSRRPPGKAPSFRR
ncbi:hypothetical protein AGDE_16505 [Angomonas deanei]|uniref:Uncharacterized protein n=1 Tax=Angomonas deanei TaxID=59799 RepID=A0A7G2CLZ5_9TRYP|nr:hypothetical protein AGDE_16505 [Angomonas deanei]CAD2219282.1 hypothetical protein, conserved [Angomonas deanei]|eukprot:EPY16984.1 hypothetical protein AGDE_16505 [Angomonas deanei]